MTAHDALLIQTFGYWIMFFAAVIEGETFLILGGIASSSGVLNFYLTLFFAILGCFLHDVSLFFLGRFFGYKILNKFPKVNQKFARINHLLEKYGFIIIIMLRFAYGFRTAFPVAIGFSKLKFYKFLIFDFIGAFIWVFVFLIIGFYFGSYINYLMQELHLKTIIKDHLIIFSLVFVILLSLFGILLLNIIKFALLAIKTKK